MEEKLFAILLITVFSPVILLLFIGLVWFYFISLIIYPFVKDDFNSNILAYDE